jgi:hypothetical protein
MNEKRWALIGKILAIASATGAIILTGLQLNDRLKTPSVYGVVEIHNYHINPKIRDMFEQRIETKSLLNLIEAQKKKGETPNKILEQVKNMASEAEGDKLFRNLDLEMSVGRVIMVFNIRNDSSSLGRDVKLILPGDGKAEVSEVGIVRTDSKRIDWSGQIPLGDVRPKGSLEVIVWPKSMLFADIGLVNPAIVHSGGTGKLMELRGFYGWDADLVMWLLNRGRIFQVALASAVITFIVILIWLAIRRGYIVLKPTKRP